MSKSQIGIVLLVVGAVLLFFGFKANGSFSSEVSNAFQGTPSEKAILLFVSGTLAAVAGLVYLKKGRGKA